MTKAKIILFIIRKKDNDISKTISRKDYYFISDDINKSQKQREKIINKFKMIGDTIYSDYVYRIYETVNVRDVNKANKELQHILIDADRIIDVPNKWLSILQSPKCRAERNFLLDLDDCTEDQYNEVIETLNTNNINIHSTNKTINGYHIITSGFNPNIVEQYSSFLELKRDAMRLIYYNRRGDNG